MIIHHIPMKAAQKSSYKKLVEYITNAQNKQERLGKITVTNCNSTEPVWASHEVEAVQAKNTRAKGDKTYHLLISFAPGEEPPQQALDIIENKVVESIGLSEHQRVSAVHHDTDNMHIHLAINKIHPTTYNMVEPFRAYKKLADVAVALEKEFNLQVTNHVPKYTQSENLAHDFEHHTGIESLLSWVKKNCLEQLQQASNWDEFNQVLAEYGLKIKVRANGFVIASKKGVMVKASTVSRNLSKSKLEAKFGKFTGDKNSNTKSTYNYTYGPINDTPIASLMYQAFEEERAANTKLFFEELNKLKAIKQHQIDKIKSKAKLKRAAIKLTRASYGEKKLLYKLVNNKIKNEIGKANKAFKLACNKLEVKHQYICWNDWLLDKGQQGNIDALTVLRQNQKKVSRNKPSLSGNGKDKPYINTAKLDSLTKEGTAIYKQGDSTIRDSGKEITLAKGLSLEGIITAIELAKEKYGNRIAANGSEQFKRVIARVAVNNNMGVTFDDPLTEKFRTEFITQQEKNNEQSTLRRGRISRTNRSDNEHAGARNRRSGHRGRVGHGSPGAKPHTERTRREPPTQNQDSLPGVSELNVVQFTRGSEVLLPNHAHDKLERKRSQPDNKMRRGLFGGLLGKKKNKKSID